MGDCASGYYKDESGSADVCVGCAASCSSDQFEQTACTSGSDRACTGCTAVDFAAAGTSVTCGSTVDSQLVGDCASGYYKDESGSADVCAPCSAVANVATGTSVTCSSAVDSQLMGDCARGFFVDESGAADVCVGCVASCSSTEFESTACTSGSDRACTGCTAVAHAAPDGTLTCGDSSTSRISGCETGYFKVAGASEDTCVQCATCEAGKHEASNCAATTDRVCTDNVCTCNDGQAARRTDCTSHQGAICTSCDNGHGLSGTDCVPDPCPRTMSVTLSVTGAQFGTTTGSVGPASEIVSGATAEVDCGIWDDSTSHPDGYTGSITLLCVLGTLSVESDSCAEHDPCSTAEDDCPATASCEHTGPGTHNCNCLSDYFGAATSGTTCTQCTDNAGTHGVAVATTVGQCSCDTGYSVGSTGSSKVITSASDMCTAVVCPQHSSGAGGGDTCTCDGGYYGPAAWDAIQNSYAACLPCSAGKSSILCFVLRFDLQPYF